MYFQALDEIQKLKSPEAINIFVKELMNLHRGQGMDLYWRDTLTCPTEEDYLEMVGNKTGGLFRLAIKLMQAESSVPMYVYHCRISPLPLPPYLSTIYIANNAMKRLRTPC